MSEKKKPDFRLSVTTREGAPVQHKGAVGAGWLNKDGSISIRLPPFVVLSAADDLIVTLFPEDSK